MMEETKKQRSSETAIAGQRKTFKFSITGSNDQKKNFAKGEEYFY
jgi:hypothetical protein